MMLLQRLAWLLLLAPTSGCLELREDDSLAPQDECSACHGGNLPANPSSPELVAAPPYNLAGDTDPKARGNGAHAAHLLENSRARTVQCSECHLVPDELYAPGHVDSPYPAELTFSGPATAFEAVPGYDAETQSCANTFCHGGHFVGGRPSGGDLVQPVWTDTSGAPAECGSCHGLPPPSPHPPEAECSDCHKNISPEGDFTRPDLHVDGNVTFYLPD